MTAWFAAAWSKMVTMTTAAVSLPLEMDARVHYRTVLFVHLYG